MQPDYMRRALDYARQRWGDQAWISTNQLTYYVGALAHDGSLVLIFGQGKTWQHAIDDAEIHPTAICHRPMT